MAPVTGQERFMAIGHANTVCFVNAINANAFTSATDLQSRGGRLILEDIVASKAQAGIRHPLVEMCTQPWEWLIVSRDVEQQLPELPGIWSSILNNVHSVSRKKQELEIAGEIAEFTAFSGDLQLAVQNAAESDPECKSYINVLGTLVRSYGGGVDGAVKFPLIKFLDRYSKTYGASVIMGEEFLTAVANSQFHAGADTTFPFFRIGLLATPATSTKQADGIAKQLIKSDCERLKNKDISITYVCSFRVLNGSKIDLF